MKKNKLFTISERLIFNIIVSFILIVIPLAFSFMLTNKNLYKEIKSYEYQTNIDSANRLRSIFDSSLESINTCITEASKSESVLNFLNCNMEDAESASKESRSLIKGIKSSQTSIISVQLYSIKNEMLLDADKGIFLPQVPSKELTNYRDWLNKSNAYSGKSLLTFRTDSGMIWIVGTCLENDSKIGYVAFCVDLNDMAQWIFNRDTTFSEKDFFIISNLGEILYYNGANKLFNNIIEGMEISSKILKTESNNVTQININDKDYLLTKTESESQNWQFALLDKTNIAEYISEKTRNITRISVILFIIISSFSSIIITIITYNPIFKIMRVLTKNNPNNNKPILNETSFIINSIIESMQHRNMIEEELERRIELLKKYQTTALQMQTDPHFLYNTLDTIRWMSLDEYGDDNLTYKMIEKLSELYREYFRTDNIVVTIRDEISFLKMYISIINVRFRDQIFFNFDVPEELNEVRCLKMSLQPIVENAIKYGLRPQFYKGGVSISVKENDGVIDLCVRDSGVGMSAETIKKKNEELKNCTDQRDEHVGLMNVNERIKLLYGESYGLYLEAPDVKSTGLKVHVIFPKNL